MLQNDNATRSVVADQTGEILMGIDRIEHFMGGDAMPADKKCAILHSQQIQVPCYAYLSCLPQFDVYLLTPVALPKKSLWQTVRSM